MVTLTCEDLPQKRAGKAEVKFTFSLDVDGYLRIEKMSLDTRKNESVSIKAQLLIEDSQL